MVESRRPHAAENVDSASEEISDEARHAGPGDFDRGLPAATPAPPPQAGRKPGTPQWAPGGSAGGEVLTADSLDIMSAAFDAAFAELLHQGRVEDYEMARKRLAKVILTIFRGGERDVKVIAAEAVSRLAPAPERAGLSPDEP